jgi:hypothetical protein
MDSKKSAPSTGKLPPTPTPSAAKRPQAPIQEGAAPAATPKTPAISSVKLKARRRPIMSLPMPQKLAPTHKPVNKAQVVYLVVSESAFR